ncbi:MAG: class I SAM-dependent methyltransferase [Hoeflea sp.]|uniref:class I SAM-dependent methyltransferase n=1 Tax=Hoeflea sp. TaxID=1940281 RepID=UPI003EF84C66
MPDLKSVIVNVHIPKTAGSNFRRQMFRTLPRVKNGAHLVGVDGGSLTENSYYPELRARAETAFAGLSENFVQFVSGHYRYRDVVDLIAPLRDRIILTTVLRDPIDRMVSDYLYCISDVYVPKASFMARYPDFGVYLKDINHQNKQLEYLRPFETATDQETLAAAREAFDFIAITERFDADFENFTKRLGYIPAEPSRHNEGQNKAQAGELREAYADQLAELLAPEYELYNELSAIDWGRTSFEMVQAPRTLDVGTARRQPDPEGDAILRAEIEALRPWHHQISLNSDVTTGIKGRDNLASDNITLTNPASVFQIQALPFLPDGMSGKTFLDCGCNAGGYCFAAKDAGAEKTFGFDVRPHWINQARFIAEKRERNSDGMQFEVADLLELQAMDEMFDVTWFSGLLYHLPDPVSGLKIAADKTRELIFVNTAVQPLADGEEERTSLVLKLEGVEQLMSGVHQLSWLPGGPKVLQQILAWLGFPETRLLYWKRQILPDGRQSLTDGRHRRGRLSMVAARTPGRLQAIDDLEME